jgi:hypothetical protein
MGPQNTFKVNWREIVCQFKAKGVDKVWRHYHRKDTQNDVIF